MFAANRHRRGLTLAEVLVSIVIAALVLVAVLSIYDQFQRSASAIIARIERPQLLTEILQRIAEDVDRLVDSEHEVRVTVDNRFDNGYPIARLVLEKSYSDRAPEDPPWKKSFGRATSTSARIASSSTANTAASCWRTNYSMLSENRSKRATPISLWREGSPPSGSAPGRASTGSTDGRARHPRPASRSCSPWRNLKRRPEETGKSRRKTNSFEPSRWTGPASYRLPLRAFRPARRSRRKSRANWAK